MITVYSRRNCPLCDKALAVLTEAGLDFNEVDISSDVSLEREFGIFVPVVQVDGRTIFEAGMDPRGLQDALREELGR